MAWLGLVKDEPKKEVPASRQPVEAVPVAAPKTSGRRRASATDDEETEAPAASSGTPSKELEKNLRRAISLSGGEGFDFVRLMTFLKKQANLDEPVRFQTAIAAAEAMGTSSDDLVKSGNDTLKVLDAQSRKNDADIAEKEEQLETDQTELKKIDAQISALTSKKETLEDKIKENSSQIADDKANFESTVNLITSEIKDIVFKVKKFSK